MRNVEEKVIQKEIKEQLLEASKVLIFREQNIIALNFLRDMSKYHKIPASASADVGIQ